VAGGARVRQPDVRRALLILVIVALAAPTAAAEADVTISVGGGKYREILYPGAFRIKGKTGDYRGTVSLEADEFPFDGNYVRIGEVGTNSKGEYVFPQVALSRNTRLRASAGSETSKTTTVFVHPGVKWNFKTVSNRQKVKISFVYTGHPGFAPPENAFFVYIWINDRSPRRLGGQRRLEQIGRAWPIDRACGKKSF